MKRVSRHLLSLETMDSFSRKRSPLHSFDPRILVLTTFFFIFFVVSFEKYSLSALIPFIFFPAFLLIVTDMPWRFFFKKVLLVSPFAVMMGIFNPFFDKSLALELGGFSVTGGELSFLSILLRFLLTVSTALILMAIVGMNGLCFSLLKFKVPKVFVVQLLFLYRYLFVLVEEAQRMLQAKELRSFGKSALSFRVYVSLLGNLLLRTFERAERIYLAMCSRGFQGNMPLAHQRKITLNQVFFLLFWLAFFILCRFYNLSVLLGNLFL